jgi:hypothetical protein
MNGPLWRRRRGSCQPNVLRFSKPGQLYDLAFALAELPGGGSVHIRGHDGGSCKARAAAEIRDSATIGRSGACERRRLNSRGGRWKADVLVVADHPERQARWFGGSTGVHGTFRKLLQGVGGL